PGGVPAAGIRGQVHSACGTGKTTMAAAAARRIVPKGRVVVLVPTLDLLTQTIREWVALGHSGPAVAVCSLEDDPELFQQGVRSTTNPIQLGLWHGRGPVTIYATYASLPVLVEAFAGSYGQRLAPVDLLVVDEAHRTSGSMGKAWADVHGQSLIPAARRLYMTATPRIWAERPNREVAEGWRDPLPEEQAASMSDTAIFGKVLWKLTLASAITRGLLARYRIIVMEITDPTLTRTKLYGEDRLTEEVRGQRMAALQAGLIRTMTEHGCASLDRPLRPCPRPRFVWPRSRKTGCLTSEVLIPITSRSLAASNLQTPLQGRARGIKANLEKNLQGARTR
uniref:DEAD/DEAH box helicase family protein n=1 Tax=Streptomyces otsuchiensis TaxID=2681388 RepID=UPI003F68AF50